MPTVYKAQSVETETPWVDIWDRMYEGLPARRILRMLDCYSRNDIELPRPGTPLTQDEILELTPIVSALTMAAVESQRMAPGVQIATFRRIAKHPPKLEDRTRFWLAFFPQEPPLAPMIERASYHSGPSAEMKQTE